MKKVKKLLGRHIRPIAPFAWLAMVSAVGAMVFQHDLLEKGPERQATNQGVTLRLQHIAGQPVVAFKNDNDCARQGLSQEFCYAALLNYTGTMRQFSLSEQPYLFKGVYQTRSLLAPPESYESVEQAQSACEQVHGRQNCQPRVNGARAEPVFVVRQGETDPSKIEIVWPLRNSGSYRARNGRTYKLET